MPLANHNAVIMETPGPAGALDGQDPAEALRLENQRLRAELQAQTQELRRSRARLVAAGDAERRRLERDLHDGAQSRFAATALYLRLAQAKAPPGGELARALDAATAELGAGLGELRELARGLHPAVLGERGLEAALESLATRAPVHVELRGGVGARLPEAVEIAAYFAVSEALANVVKHARAEHVSVDVRHARGRLVVEVADDGRGGARAHAGSGLRGLADRVGAVDGRLEVHSPPGAGTRVRVEIPCPAPDAGDAARDRAAGHAAPPGVRPKACEAHVRPRCHRFLHRE
jgi:signal transduction histidine kinase